MAAVNPNEKRSMILILDTCVGRAYSMHTAMVDDLGIFPHGS